MKLGRDGIWIYYHASSVRSRLAAGESIACFTTTAAPEARQSPVLCGEARQPGRGGVVPRRSARDWLHSPSRRRDQRAAKSAHSTGGPGGARNERPAVAGFRNQCPGRAKPSLPPRSARRSARQPRGGTATAPGAEPGQGGARPCEAALFFAGACRACSAMGPAGGQGGTGRARTRGSRTA